MTEPVVNITDLRFTWPGRAGFALAVPRFRIAAGASVLLLGASGSGKSTLLSLICGTLAARSGLLRVCGTDLHTLSGAARDRFRAEHLGVIFQQFNLLPFGTVADNIELPLRFAPARRARAARDEAVALCGALGLPAECLRAKARTLSVGQQQRVAVARALIGRPALIVADEPTSALDEDAQGAFLDLLFQQTAQYGTSLLMVSHDARMAPRFDTVIRLEDILARQVA